MLPTRKLLAPKFPRHQLLNIISALFPAIYRVSGHWLIRSLSDVLYDASSAHAQLCTEENWVCFCKNVFAWRGRPLLWQSNRLQVRRTVCRERNYARGGCRIATSTQFVKSLRELKCAQCGSHRIRRSGRHNVWERIAGVIVLPYRCDVCGERCFKLRSSMMRTRSDEKGKAPTS